MRATGISPACNAAAAVSPSDNEWTTPETTAVAPAPKQRVRRRRAVANARAAGASPVASIVTATGPPSSSSSFLELRHLHALRRGAKGRVRQRRGDEAPRRALVACRLATKRWRGASLLEVVRITLAQRTSGYFGEFALFRHRYQRNSSATSRVINTRTASSRSVPRFRHDNT